MNFLREYFHIKSKEEWTCERIDLEGNEELRIEAPSLSPNV